MNQFINVGRAAELINNIVDCNRCAVCDKLIGKGVRYACGCTSCVVCVSATESCPLCLTPPDATSFVPPSIDRPLTLRSKNAQNLLNSFQTCFSIDIERNKDSKKLKVEKELFPKCIQAPVKYYNKRKSAKASVENKENITFFPGEEVYRNKMENSNANVRQWLDNCVKRKPLGDLNNSNRDRRPLKTLNTLNVLNRSPKKRKNNEIWNDENATMQQYIDDFYETPFKIKKIKSVQNGVDSASKQNSNKDDSGIAIEEDNSIVVLDDSQSIRVDKDANALLAVLEADNARHSTSQDPINNIQSDKLPQNNLSVPFYKRSSLYRSCFNCKDYYKVVNRNRSEPKIYITVESKNFTATINISEAEETSRISSKKSVEVQTEGYITEEIYYHDKTDGSVSDDIFLGEADDLTCAETSINKSTNVVIPESDSDEDMEHSMSLEVTAQVHRSYDENVLEDVEDLEEHSRRPRKCARGYTPTSTDSSEKENYNPNRKRTTKSKKKPVKK